MEWFEIIQEAGSLSLSAFWFPLLVWTLLALAASVLIHAAKPLNAVYQYHGRIALLLTLPVGLAASYLAGLPGTGVSGGSLPSLKLIVVDNPLSASAATTAPAATPIPLWGDPLFWVGIGIGTALLLALVRLVIVCVDYCRLQKHARAFKFHSIYRLPDISEGNRLLAFKSRRHVTITFSEYTQVPYTFGWFTCRVVIPKKLAENPETLNMVLRHELIHIEQRDFVLNNLLLMVRSLFWFHPLVHYLYSHFKDWQEIRCDSRVLDDSTISRKRYARLLLELSGKRNSYRPAALGMAANNKSTLKKRIEIMKTQSFSYRAIRSSIMATISAGLLITGVMACSDLHKTDKTTTPGQQDIEIKGEVETGFKLDSPSKSSKTPLYIIDGEPAHKKTLSDIEPKNIKSIEVLKGDTAVSEYGERAQDGVVLITTKSPGEVDMHADIQVKQVREAAARALEEKNTDTIQNSIELKLLGNRKVSLAGKTVTIDNLLQHIRNNYRPANEQLIRFIVKRDVTYGEVIDVQDVLREAGTLKINYVEEHQ